MPPDSGESAPNKARFRRLALALVCLVRVRRWFWPFRGSGGFVSFGFWVAFGIGSGRCTEADAKKSRAKKSGARKAGAKKAGAKKAVGEKAGA